MVQNRTIEVGGVWANNAADVPAEPISETTYKDSTLSSSEIEEGWPYDKRVDSSKHNEIMYRLTSLLRSLEQIGILPWSALTTYALDSICMGSDGRIYTSLQNTNLNHDPISSPSWWAPRIVDTNNSQIITGQKTLTSPLITGVLTLLGNSNGTITSATQSSMHALELRPKSGQNYITLYGDSDSIHPGKIHIGIPERVGFQMMNDGSVYIPYRFRARNQVGEIFFVATSSVPYGALKCDGATISRTAYAQLFSVIGTAFGAGDGSTTFRLPDLRGEFLRAWDDGRGVDSGRVFGSAQAQQTDNLRSIQTRVVGGQGYHDREIPSTGDFSSNTESGGESGTGIVVQARHWNRETRPRNIALLACIRY